MKMGMNSFTEAAYVGQILHRFERHVQKDTDLWNVRCPFCGDSKRNKSKMRGYIYKAGNHLRYKCHNCDANLSFGELLKSLDPMVYGDFILEQYGDRERPTPASFAPKKFVPVKDPLEALERLSELPSDHPAPTYIIGRKLPPETLSRLFYAPAFKTWVNTFREGKFKDVTKDEPRIVIPFFDLEGKLVGIQGRSLDPKAGLRYITIKIEPVPMFYGIDRVDLSKTVYVTEGPFDSECLDNAISGDGLSGIKRLLKLVPDPVFVADNQPRNEEVCKSIERIISSGAKIVLFPDGMKSKDINSLAQLGVSRRQLHRMLEQNTLSGLAATLRFSEWKKV